MENIYQALNALGSTAWKVNQRVLDVVEALWELGGDNCEIPPRFDTKLPPVGEEGIVIGCYAWLRSLIVGKTPQWFKETRKIRKLNSVPTRHLSYNDYSSHRS